MEATADGLLERLASAPQQAGILLDFDGVLAPIVVRPADAYPPPAARAELARLVEAYALVAVVSGRATADVRERLDVAGVIVVGSHGLELDPEAEQWRPRLRAFAADAPWPRAQIDEKGLAVAFHYREARDERAALLELERLAETAVAEGFVARFGRKVLEVLPPLGSNKGSAVRRLLADARLDRALVAGDDTTDLDAFHAVDGLELAVRVAVVSAEAPAVLRDAADVVVDSPEEFLDLLRRL